MLKNGIKCGLKKIISKDLANFIYQYFLNKRKVARVLFDEKYISPFNKEYGDADDKSYIAKKIITQQENHLKFRDENNKLVEYRSAGGLNYIIEDV